MSLPGAAGQAACGKPLHLAGTLSAATPPCITHALPPPAPSPRSYKHLQLTLTDKHSVLVDAGGWGGRRSGVGRMPLDRSLVGTCSLSSALVPTCLAGDSWFLAAKLKLPGKATFEIQASPPVGS